jgi:hypothetical protein
VSAVAEQSEAKADEKTESADQQEPVSIEPPRSWTKEDKDLFASLPRATQERLAEREWLRESDFLRRQNEAAEKLKGSAPSMRHDCGSCLRSPNDDSVRRIQA